MYCIMSFRIHKSNIKSNTSPENQTRDSLLPLLSPPFVFFLFFCNDTPQILCQFIPHIMQYQIIFWLMSDIHLNQSNPLIIQQNTKNSAHQSSLPWHLPLLGHNITKFHFSTALTHFPAFSLVTKSQWSVFHWSKSSTSNLPHWITLHY